MALANLNNPKQLPLILHSLKPLDENYILFLKTFKTIITIEDGVTKVLECNP
jgi:hypothetical protein